MSECERCRKLEEESMVKGRTIMQLLEIIERLQNPLYRHVKPKLSQDVKVYGNLGREEPLIGGDT
jgi:hypothetical protein